MMNKKKFIKDLSEKNEERKRIISLQKRFSKGEITEEDLTEEEIYELHKLYDEQIEKLKIKKEKYKKDIIEIRKQIKNNK